MNTDWNCWFKIAAFSVVSVHNCSFLFEWGNTFLISPGIFHGKQATSVRVIEVLLYNIVYSLPQSSWDKTFHIDLPQKYSFF